MAWASLLGALTGVGVTWCVDGLETAKPRRRGVRGAASQGGVALRAPRTPALWGLQQLALRPSAWQATPRVTDHHQRHLGRQPKHRQLLAAAAAADDDRARRSGRAPPPPAHDASLAPKNTPKQNDSFKNGLCQLPVYRKPWEHVLSAFAGAAVFEYVAASEQTMVREIERRYAELGVGGGAPAAKK